MKNIFFIFLVLIVSFNSALASIAPPDGSFFSPQVSPDGSRYLWESLKKSGSIWATDLDGKNLEFITTGHSPSWKDSDSFNFVKSADDGHVVLWQHLYEYSFNRGIAALVTENSDNPDYQTVSIQNNFIFIEGQPLSGKVIVIDPGHGNNSGAYSKHSKRFEDRYTLESAFIVKDYLEASGATVRLTRTDNSICPALSARVNFSNSVGAKAFVSIHYNSAVNESANGLEVFNRSYNTNSKSMAKKVHDQMVKESGMHSRGVKGDKEVLGFYLGVLSSSHKTDYRCLTEGGFLSNSADSSEIDRLDWNEGLSWAIYAGICEVLGVKANPRVPHILTSIEEGFINPLNSNWLGTGTLNINTDTPEGDSATVLLASGSDKDGVLRTGNSCWVDYKVSSTMRRVSGDAVSFGMIARCTFLDKENLLGYIFVADESKGKALLYKSTGNDETHLLIGSLPLSETFDYTTWHKFEINFKDNLIEALIDGQPLTIENKNLTEPVKASTNSLENGKAGVFIQKSTRQAVLEIDSFSIKTVE
jgi:N-acetylmuramoyl-L-alanine amidase